MALNKSEVTESQKRHAEGLIALVKERDALQARAEAAEARVKELESVHLRAVQLLERAPSCSEVLEALEYLKSCKGAPSAAEAERDALRKEREVIRRELKNAGIVQCDYPLDTFPDARSWIWIPDHNEGTATTAVAPTIAALLSEDPPEEAVCETCGGTGNCTDPGPYDDGVETFRVHPCPDCQKESQS